MKEYRIPWGKWYEESERVLTFPDTWDVHYQSMQSRKAISEEEILDRIDHPIGQKKLEELAEGKKSACIIVDDISRPTPCKMLLPMVIKKIEAAGIKPENIKVIIALGGHRPMTKQEMEIKVGRWVLDHVQVLNHSPFSADIAVIEKDGQKIEINRNFIDSDLRIAIGCLVPHTLAGFSGGAKAVIPGIGGIDTLEQNHTLVFADKDSGMSFKTSTCDPDNPMRQNMEKLVGEVGLDFILNVVLNDKMEVAEAFAGHFIEAHRAACKEAMEILKTPIVKDADIIITSAYPKDTEYSQLGTCFAVLGHYKEKSIKKDGTIVAMTAASEGAGFHYLFGPGMRLFSPHEFNIPPMELKGTETIIYSEGVNSIDIRQFYTKESPEIQNDWEEILGHLKKKYMGRNPVVAIYPQGAVQIGYMEE